MSNLVCQGNFSSFFKMNFFLYIDILNNLFSMLTFPPELEIDKQTPFFD